MKNYFETMRHGSDVKRICDVFMAHGETLHPLEAERLWDDYSDSMAAGWMGLPDNDEELWEFVKHRISLGE